MRETITTSMRHIFQDRAVAAVFVILMLLCMISAIYFGIRIETSDIQVATHYTSYGGVNFYTDQWWYAISFVVIFLMIAALHTAIAMKLYSLKSRQIVLGFGLFSIGLVVFATITLNYIVNVAFPL